jgi:hypothetical protein
MLIFVKSGDENAVVHVHKRVDDDVMSFDVIGLDEFNLR